MDFCNKRIALCLSGQARAVKYCYPSILENIIKPFGKVDVFIHSWLVAANNFDIFHTNLFDSTVQEYTDIYRPKDSLFEDFETSEYHQYNNMKERIHIAFYTVFMANQIKCRYEEKHGFIYDYVIRFRSDLMVKEMIDLKDFKWIDERSVIIPNYRFDFGGINDQVAIGTSFAINRYCDLHNHIFRYLHQENQQYDPHRLLQYHLASSGLNVQRSNLDYDIVKKRMQHDMKGYVQTARK